LQATPYTRIRFGLEHGGRSGFALETLVDLVREALTFQALDGHVDVEL